MLILLSGYGNHSNRLFQTIHFEAYCKENKEVFINFALSEIDYLYGIHSFPMQQLWKFIIRLLKKIKILQIISFDTDDEIIIEKNSLLLKKKGIKIVEGWYFRKTDLTIKYHTFFQNKYSLLPKYIRNNDLDIKLINYTKERKIVGIHIRRGDYKQWQDGKYYFDDNIYFSMLNMLETENIQYKCLFVIFSNEPVHISKENVIVSQNQWYIDHFLMTKCDYLIGPPSTFSGWASYIGEIPLYYITSSNIPKISFKEFIVLQG